MSKQSVAKENDVKPGGLLRVEVDGTAVCLARVADGTFYAIGDECTHEDASLSEGELNGTDVTCWMHSSVFDVKTGAVKEAPATVPARTFRVTVESGEVFVEAGE